jgi:formylglycine-generating enzyme required for sulfatase activity/predicted Ser/Thr protein kinase
MLPPNTILRERYRIISAFGHGGMGAVYQAMDENLNCLVAVKETFAKADEHRRAFRREAELLANLNHPTLPKVMDHFTHGDGQFLVMQFVSGHDLAELLELREQPFAVDKVLAWAGQLLDALEELHSYDPPIVHRDIKPSNLKVTPKGRVVLLDFGLAKGAAGQMSTADADSQPKSIYGYTPNYAPLEQIRGAGTDPRSDLYSLGATVWSLLTGKVPPDALSRVADKEEGKPDPLIGAHELNASVPLSVSDAISRAMNLNRNQRTATAAEMRSDLRADPQSAAEHSTSGAKENRAAENLSPRKDSSGEAETVGIPDAAVSTVQPQSPQTLVVPQPPRIPSQSSQVGPTVASLSPAESMTHKNPLAIVGASVVIGGVGFILLLVLVISLAIWRPWSKNSNSSNRSSTAPRNMAEQIGLDLAPIPRGSFLMGDSLASPVHTVNITRDFYLSRFEVTQSQWQTVMGNNPSKFNACGGNCPVEMITWNDAQEFIRKLNQQESKYIYRLPTEAEWEYACRAGTTGDYYGTLSEIGWYFQNSGGTTHPRGLKKANAFGLYDMSGNVWEWTEDRTHFNYQGAPSDGRAWVDSGDAPNHVIRGGAWFNTSEYLTSPRRAWTDAKAPDSSGNHIGFRLAAALRKP